MGLQRTPPQKVQPLPSAIGDVPPEEQSMEQPTPTEADKTNISLPTPSQAFIPRNPKVLRTPPGGTSSLPLATLSGLGQSSSRPDLAGREEGVIVDHDDEEARDEAAVLMDIDEPEPDMGTEPTSHPPVHQSYAAIGAAPAPTPATAQRKITPEPTIPQTSTTPASAHTASTSQIPQAPTTPAAQRAQPKTPRSRSRRQTVTLPDPPAPIQLDEPVEFGRRYQLTMETLDRAIKAGVQRWSVGTFKGCFPKLAEQKPEAMENVYHSTAQSMRTAILTQAESLLKHYKTGPALQAIDDVDREAREYARANPSESGSGGSSRPDAWRPNISPQALVAATTLPIYDEAYSKLREEYLGLHQDITERFASIRQKQAILKDIEANVSDGVVDLEKTIQVLDQLPVDDMSLWMETAETKLDTRAPERVG